MSYNEKMYALGSKRSVIREIFEYCKQRGAEIGKDKVYDFSIGNPSVPPPPQIEQAIIDLVKTQNSVLLHGYTSAQGDLNTRKAVANNIAGRFGVDIDENWIYMTCGAAASLTVSLKAILNEGDECIVFAPFFTEYRVFINNAGGVVVQSEPLANLQIDVADLEGKITPKTRAVIINSPNNPSGVVYTEQTIKAVCKVLKAKSEQYGNPIYAICDEPYRELVYEGVQVPYIMNYYDDSLVCYSYSKSLSLPGERIGYIAVNPKAENAKQIYLSVCGAGRSLGYVCAPSLMQQVITRCVDVSVDVSPYEKNRKLLYESLVKMGFDCIKPDGAFYLFVKTPCLDAYEFFERAKAKEILVVPCDDFGVKGYVRIAYCVDYDRIKNSLVYFEQLAKEYGLSK